jgi:two-component system, OmpR family, sensor histidine kinase KdpD
VRDRVVVRVTDEGPGVAPGDRARVFEAFYRGESSPDSPGTGLGLAIANAIVTAHDGRIWVEDATGGGASFVFEIPIHRGPVLEGNRPPADAPERRSEQEAPA